MRAWLTRGYSLREIAAAMAAALPGHEVLASGAAAARGAIPGAVPNTIPGTILEPDPVDDAGYLDFVRAAVRTHGIELVVPTRRAALLDRARDSLGCRVETAAPAPMLELIHDKLAFADALADDPLLAPTLPVRSVAELRAGLDDFRARGIPACVKPARGVNGIGFLAFTDRPRLAQLAEPELRETRPDTFVAALAEAEGDGPCPPHVLMEFLPGIEISVDALAWRGRLLGHAARTKRSAEVQELTTEHPLAPAVARLVTRFALHGLVSVQFRLDARGAPRLLEINPRPAGGCTFAEAAGCGLVAAWARLLVGEIGPDEVRVPRVAALLRRGATTAVEPLEPAAPADSPADAFDAGPADARCAA